MFQTTNQPLLLYKSPFSHRFPMVFPWFSQPPNHQPDGDFPPAIKQGNGQSPDVVRCFSRHGWFVQGDSKKRPRLMTPEGKSPY